MPQKSIAGAALHMTRMQVRAALRPPRAVRSGRNEFGRFTTFLYPRVTVTFQGGRRVTGLRTRSALERTPSGVGVGSTEARVKARVPGVDCKTELGARQCVVGVFAPGRVVTAFGIARGHVRSVVVGIVID